MGKSFSVGEIAIFRYSGMPQYHGQEVEVLGLQGCPKCGRNPIGRYEIRMQDGRRLCAGALTLHKRRPPPDWVKLCNLTDLPREVEHV